MRFRSSSIQPVVYRRPRGAAVPSPSGERFLQVLRQLGSCCSLRAATEAVQAPEALVTPPAVRTRRQMRTARVSWW
jgi:hypothetical protein